MKCLIFITNSPLHHWQLYSHRSNSAVEGPASWLLLPPDSCYLLPPATSWLLLTAASCLLLPDTGCLLLFASCFPLPSSLLYHTCDLCWFLLPNTCCLLPAYCCLLSSACYLQLPSSGYMLPAASYLLLPASYMGWLKVPLSFSFHDRGWNIPSCAPVFSKTPVLITENISLRLNDICNLSERMVPVYGWEILYRKGWGWYITISTQILAMLNRAISQAKPSCSIFVSSKLWEIETMCNGIYPLLQPPARCTVTLFKF